MNLNPMTTVVHSDSGADSKLRLSQVVTTIMMRMTVTHFQCLTIARISRSSKVVVGSGAGGVVVVLCRHDTHRLHVQPDGPGDIPTSSEAGTQLPELRGHSEGPQDRRWHG